MLAGIAKRQSTGDTQQYIKGKTTRQLGLSISTSTAKHDSHIFNVIIQWYYR